ncbi:MAG: hypothetical protein AAF772_00550 [Acidobacteriota bacterium]
MRTCLVTVFVLMMISVAGNAPIDANGVTWGCLVCEEDVYSSSLTPDYYCKQVGNHEQGDGIECHLLCFSGCSCFVPPNPCLNVDVTGGGSGGGSGGGGGGTCNTSGFCPAECFNCSGGGIAY